MYFLFLFFMFTYLFIVKNQHEIWIENFNIKDKYYIKLFSNNIKRKLKYYNNN
jgi:hypothetical protein